MIELEILVEVFDSILQAQSVLQRFKYEGSRTTVDTYYYDPLRDRLKPQPDGKLHASFRVRNQEENYTLTYKDDHYENGTWQYSDEYEVNVDNLDTITKIIQKLELKQLIVVESEKFFYEFQNYQIVLESVKGLGTFLEVEYKGASEKDPLILLKAEMQKFIDSLSLHVSTELNAGKPELLIKKKNLTF